MSYITDCEMAMPYVCACCNGNGQGVRVTAGAQWMELSTIGLPQMWLCPTCVRGVNAVFYQHLAMIGINPTIALEERLYQIWCDVLAAHPVLARIRHEIAMNAGWWRSRM